MNALIHFFFHLGRKLIIYHSCTMETTKVVSMYARIKWCGMIRNNRWKTSPLFWISEYTKTWIRQK